MKYKISRAFVNVRKNRNIIHIVFSKLLLFLIMCTIGCSHSEQKKYVANNIDSSSVTTYECGDEIYLLNVLENKDENELLVSISKDDTIKKKLQLKTVDNKIKAEVQDYLDNGDKLKTKTTYTFDTHMAFNLLADNVFSFFYYPYVQPNKDDYLVSCFDNLKINSYVPRSNLNYSSRIDSVFLSKKNDNFVFRYQQTTFIKKDTIYTIGNQLINKRLSKYSEYSDTIFKATKVGSMWNVRFFNTPDVIFKQYSFEKYDSLVFKSLKQENIGMFKVYYNKNQVVDSINNDVSFPLKR